MATNRNAIIRYQALDKCFHNRGRKYFIDDLIEGYKIGYYQKNNFTNHVTKRPNN